MNEPKDLKNRHGPVVFRSASRGAHLGVSDPTPKRPPAARRPLPQPDPAPRAGSRAAASALLASQRPVRGVIVTPAAPQDALPGPLALRRPHVGAMLADAYTVAGAEMARLRRLVETGQPLSWNDAKAYQILTQTLVALAKEEREQAHEDPPEQLSTEELARRTEAAIAYLRAVDEAAAPPQRPGEQRDRDKPDP